jgi:transcriptional regulator with XRE-family HTH domain
MTQPQLSRLESGGATPTEPLLARLATALKADLDIAPVKPASLKSEMAGQVMIP